LLASGAITFGICSYNSCFKKKIEQ
jgi:hypothetical protein